MASRNWMFTLNNPGSENPLEWEHKYLVFQKESGEQQTEHFQGYVHFSSAKTLDQVRSICERAHWEKRQGSHKQAKEYCMKDDTRLDGPWESGSEPQQGARSDLNHVREMITDGCTDIEIADEHFGSYIRYYRGFQQYRLIAHPPRSWKTHVSVFYGPPGSGKSRRCLEENPGAYWKPHGKWWDGYLTQETVIVDDFYGWLPYSQLLNLMDRYPLNVETKGGTVSFVAKRIIFTSNSHPSEWYQFAFGALERRIDNLELIQ